MKKSLALILLAIVLTFFISSPVYASSNFTDEEQAIIDASKTQPIRVGVVDNSAPICYWDEAKQAYVGIIVDMLNAVSAKTGLCFEYVSVNLDRLADVANPNEDSPALVLGLVNCPEMPDTRNWYLSGALHSDMLTVVGLQGDEFGGSTKTVAVMSNFVMAMQFAGIYMPDYTVVGYESIEDCLDAVAKGEADAAVYLQSCINYLQQKPIYEKLEIISTYGTPVYVGVGGFTSQAKGILSIVDKGLSEVTDDEHLAIVINYTLLNAYKLTTQDVFYKYRSFIALIAVLVLALVVTLVALYLNRRNSERKNQEALAIARQASQAKGNFMSRMSHEIRTPLNAVIGYNTIARNEMTEAKTEAEIRASQMKVMDCLTKSDIASRHLLTIINDVLDMSAIEEGKIVVVNERFDFRGFITSLTAVFYSQAKAKGVNFDVVFHSDMEEWVKGDQMRVNQVLTNLLSNAIKFTRENGSVVLNIRPVTSEEVVSVRFEVTDNGIGMSEEYISRIWNPFEQADSSISRRYGGTGLGLSITKTLVDLMQGKIEVKSALGKGSTFTVDLDFQRTSQPEERSFYDFSKINALIVDDDVATCDYIRLLLTRSGVKSTAVTSGEAALHAVSEALETMPYTMCLVDWRMPKMDGIETIKRIREIAGNELPIVVITAYDYSEVAEEAIKVGINMFISKPLFQSSLFNLLANISGTMSHPKPKEKQKDYDFEGRRVLLAEDNAMNMEIAATILESANLVVDRAWNGQEALTKFQSVPVGTYKAILMDVQMPIMDGYNATRLIRQSTHPEAKCIPIIAMTADAFAENVAESIASGMNDHVSKPIDLDILFETLAKYFK